MGIPPAAAAFMEPSVSSSMNYSFPPPNADVNARMDDADDGPTRSVAAIALTPFDISKERGSSQPFLHSASSPTMPVAFDVKRESYSHSASLPITQGKSRSVEFQVKSIAVQLPECWSPPWIDKLPRYFPLERTHRRVKLEECSLGDVLLRVVGTLRKMSVQAKYFSRPVSVDEVWKNDSIVFMIEYRAHVYSTLSFFQASAALFTTENVELYLAFWKSDDDKEVIVEVQRRRGDTVIFHQYANCIMNAASGTLDISLFTNDEGSILYLQSTEKKLRSELSRIAPESDIDKESVVVLEIVYDLLTKERRDARQLGMEGVCILVNARKTVLSAAIRTSSAILLGGETKASQGLHEVLLGIIQKRRIGDEVTGGDYPEDSDDEEYFLDDDDELRDYSPEYKEEITLFYNLALNALSHALEVVTNFGVLDQSFSASSVVDTFLYYARQQTDADILLTLLETLRKAYLKPHNAWLAAKCLRFICSASPTATERTLKLGGIGCAEMAFDVGVESHAKLESECRMLQGVLTC